MQLTYTAEKLYGKEIGEMDEPPVGEMKGNEIRYTESSV